MERNRTAVARLVSASPTRLRYVTRVLALYRKADDALKQQGRHWYAQEHEYASWLAQNTGVPLQLVCACLAVLSPRCQWPRVKGACGELLAGRNPAGLFNRSLEKARAILKAGNTDFIHPSHAPKTWAFWHNLWRPDDPKPVTLDSWMFRAHGLSAGSGLRAYRTLADGYRSVAGELGLIPNQLQAIVWLYARAQLRRDRNHER